MTRRLRSRLWTRFSICCIALPSGILTKVRFADRMDNRVVYGTPDWPDFVLLAVSEVRQFGVPACR